MSAPTTGPFERPVIQAPNPLPSHIDWRMVESLLGVEIVQGHPGDSDDSLFVANSHRGLLSAEANEVNSVGRFPNLLRLRRAFDLCGLTGPEGDISDGFVEGFSLGLHSSLHSSVSGHVEGKPPADSLSGESAGGAR